MKTETKAPPRPQAINDNLIPAVQRLVQAVRVIRAVPVRQVGMAKA